MAGPLDAIRVVEISMFQQGPVAGMRLGDLGADVIRSGGKRRWQDFPRTSVKPLRRGAEEPLTSESIRMKS